MDDDALIIAVVTGGREFFPSEASLEPLARLFADLHVTVLRQGDARGVDVTVRDWFRANRPAIHVEDWPADWDRFGEPAGPRRSLGMLDGTAGYVIREAAAKLATLGQPANFCFAYPGGTGTQGCVAGALVRKIALWRWSERDSRWVSQSEFKRTS